MRPARSFVPSSHPHSLVIPSYPRHSLLQSPTLMFPPPPPIILLLIIPAPATITLRPPPSSTRRPTITPPLLRILMAPHTAQQRSPQRPQTGKNRIPDDSSSTSPQERRNAALFLRARGLLAFVAMVSSSAVAAAAASTPTPTAASGVGFIAGFPAVGSGRSAAYGREAWDWFAGWKGVALLLNWVLSGLIW